MRRLIEKGMSPITVISILRQCQNDPSQLHPEELQIAVEILTAALEKVGGPDVRENVEESV